MSRPTSPTFSTTKDPLSSLLEGEGRQNVNKTPTSSLQNALDQKSFIVPIVMKYLDVRSLLSFSTTSRIHHSHLGAEMIRRGSVVESMALTTRSLVGSAADRDVFMVSNVHFDIAEGLVKVSKDLLGPLSSKNPYFHVLFQHLQLLPRIFYVGPQNGPLGAIRTLSPLAMEYACRSINLLSCAPTICRQLGVYYLDILHTLHITIARTHFDRLRLAARMAVYAISNAQLQEYLECVLHVLQDHQDDTWEEWAVVLSTIKEYGLDPEKVQEGAIGLIFPFVRGVFFIYRAPSPTADPNDVDIDV